MLPSVAKTYAPVGQSPTIICDAKNKSFVSVSGAITPEGGFYFEVREQEGFKQMGLSRFLDNLVAYFKQRVLVVWDNAPSHKSNHMKTYLTAQSADCPRVWLANTPPYSPELNPIEQVWGYVKGKLANQFFRTTKALKKAVEEELKKVQQDKQLIQRFFVHKELHCYEFYTSKKE